MFIQIVIDFSSLFLLNIPAYALCVNINAAIIIFLSVYALLIPAGMLIHDLRDPGLYSDKMPRCAFRWHKALSPKYEKWARKRVESKTATKLTTENLSVGSA